MYMKRTEERGERKGVNTQTGPQIITQQARASLGLNINVVAMGNGDVRLVSCRWLAAIFCTH